GVGLVCDVPVRSYLPIRVAAALRRRVGPLDGLPALVLSDGQGASAVGDGLTAAGARVRQLELASRAVDGRGRQPLERAIARGGLDAVVLPSSSAAEALAAAGLALPRSVDVVAIGPATAATAVRLGYASARPAEGAGARGLVEELTRRLGEARETPRQASASAE